MLGTFKMMLMLVQITFTFTYVPCYFTVMRVAVVRLKCRWID